MGNIHRKKGELPDELTGLTENEVKLVQQTWRKFSTENPECGVLLFLSLFIKHPEYIQLFDPFRGQAIAALKDNPTFRAHGCSIGYHITSMVESLRDPGTFEILVRRNATEHMRRKGVKPLHFEVMGQRIVDVLQATDERHMTPAAVQAWRKFFACMVAIIQDVYDKAAAERAERASIASAASEYYSRTSTVKDETMLTLTPVRSTAASNGGGSDRAKVAASATLPAAHAVTAAKRAPRIIRQQSAVSTKASSGSEGHKADADTTSRQGRSAAKKTAKEKAPTMEGSRKKEPRKQRP
ncbi:cytoglobin-1-like [Amblyomma americanum]